MSAEFVCGAAAGALADTCMFPFDTLRTRLMVRASARGMVAEGAALVRAEGVRALYKGLPVQLLASLPGNGLFYATYEAVKALAAERLSMPAAIHAVAGAAACVASLTVRKRCGATRCAREYVEMTAVRSCAGVHADGSDQAADDGE